MAIERVLVVGLFHLGTALIVLLYLIDAVNLARKAEWALVIASSVVAGLYAACWLVLLLCLL